MSKDIPTISKMRVLGPSRLTVTWKGGGTDAVDLTGWIATGDNILRPLLDEKIFKTARIGEYGRMVAWADNEDLAIDAFHLKRIADEQRPIEATEFVRWQSANNFTNEEAAHIVGVSRSTWAAMKSGSADVPLTTVIAFRAIQRDPVIMQAHFRPLKGAPGRPSKNAN
jgi:hypothetical protein